MKILLKELSLTNFKGIRSLTIKFYGETNVYGRNEAGKTTLMDAFLWLFFGKDSTDRKDFEIKTLDENNQPFHRLDHEVSALIDIDGQSINIRRSLKEKWTKKRGSESTEFTGHQTDFYWNDVPMKESEYQAKIAGIINEGLFKLLTNTGYYSSMAWRDRRNVLLSIAGKIEDADVIDSISTLYNKTQIEILTNAINQNKTIDEFKREISANKKKLKDELDVLPSRIDEANRSLPEEIDYSIVEKKIAVSENDIEKIDTLLTNKSQAHKDHQDLIRTLLDKVHVIKTSMSDMEFVFKNDVQLHKQAREQKISSSKSDLRKLNDDLTTTRREYTNASSLIDNLTKEKESLTKKWFDIDAENIKFNDGEFCCPACKREFEPGDVEEKKQTLTANFNSDKVTRLNQITEKGKSIRIEINDLETKLSNLKSKGENLNTEIAAISNRISELDIQHSRLCADEEGELSKTISKNVEYNNKKKELDELTEKINVPFKAEDNSELITRKKLISVELDDHKKELATKGQRDKQLKRITELTEHEKKLAQELASFEGIEFCIEQFTKTKMNMLEARINGRFQIVRFKMFEEQINGAQIEACITLVNGVPYSDINTAAKIQAGLDIINTLSAHYGIQAPVWVDNRESVTNLPDTDCQLINLIVSPKDKKLRIESSVKEEAVA